MAQRSVAKVRGGEGQSGLHSWLAKEAVVGRRSGCEGSGCALRRPRKPTGHVQKQHRL